jgi:hypothetical protein
MAVMKIVLARLKVDIRTEGFSSKDLYGLIYVWSLTLLG